MRSGSASGEGALRRARIDPRGDFSSPGFCRCGRWDLPAVRSCGVEQIACCSLLHALFPLCSALRCVLNLDCCSFCGGSVVAWPGARRPSSSSPTRAREGHTLVGASARGLSGPSSWPINSSLPSAAWRPGYGGVCLGSSADSASWPIAYASSSSSMAGTHGGELPPARSPCLPGWASGTGQRRGIPRQASASMIEAACCGFAKIHCRPLTTSDARLLGPPDQLRGSLPSATRYRFR
jgi:hypothetical protein